MRHPPFKAIALALAIGAVGTPLAAQDLTLNWNPRSGDVWVDRQLGDINQYGMQHRGLFINEMVGHYGAPRDLVVELLVNRGWGPGDIYYACAIARVAGVPCRNVVDERERQRGQGWGVVAQRMGIKPGSAEFHRLKRGFVPSYDRWGRDVVLDRELQRAYPDRGRGRGNGGHRGNGNGNAAVAPRTKPATPPGQQNRARGHERPAQPQGRGPGQVRQGSRLIEADALPVPRPARHRRATDNGGTLLPAAES